MEILVARSPWRRLVGLALRRRAPPDTALLLPRCRSVHTFGMRFALDLVWLDARGNVIAVDEAVPPCRVRSRRAAASVVEVVAGEGRRVAAGLTGREFALYGPEHSQDLDISSPGGSPCRAPGQFDSSSPR